MATTLFEVDTKAKVLLPMRPVSMYEAGLTEPQDLEAWLASAHIDLFGRRILWIARQDCPAHDQRSDLVGVADTGELVLAELKRGEVDQAAVTQALTYAAEYATRNARDLAGLFATNSDRNCAHGLVTRADSDDDAEARLVKHAPDEDLNQRQVIILVGESFSAGVLAVCEYLNRSALNGTFTIECWRYGLRMNSAQHFMVLEQIVPAQTVRDQIEVLRAESGSRARARDPVRMQLMRSIMEALREANDTDVYRSMGQSYECTVRLNAWPPSCETWLSIHSSSGVPRLYLKPTTVSDAAVTSNGTFEKGTDGEYATIALLAHPIGDKADATRIASDVIALLKLLQPVPQHQAAPTA